MVTHTECQKIVARVIAERDALRAEVERLRDVEKAFNELSSDYIAGAWRTHDAVKAMRKLSEILGCESDDDVLLAVDRLREALRPFAPFSIAQLDAIRSEHSEVVLSRPISDFRRAAEAMKGASDDQNPSSHG